MSRFFATTYDYASGSSSSEEDLLSSSDEDLLLSSSSGEEEESNDSFFDESESESDFDSDDSDSKPYGPDWFKKPEFRKGGANKFLKNAYDSDEDESDDGQKVIVKSAKEKLLDEMQTIYNKIDAAELVQDWTIIFTELENITKLLVRSQQQNFGIPNIFIKVIAQIEDAVNDAKQDELTNKASARAFNNTRQRIKKVARENEEQLANLRKDPESFDKEPTVDLEAMNNKEATPQLTLKNAAANLSSVSATSEINFFAAYQIVLESRGKKNVDHQSMVKTMQELVNIAKTPYESVMAYLLLIPVRFDSSANLAYQPVDQWKSSLNDIENLLDILDQNIKTYQVSEIAPRNENIEIEPKANENGIKQILGSLFSFVERLDDEFKKSLLNTDPHSSDYLLRLKDEQVIYNLILRTQLYLEFTLPEDKQEKLLSRVFIKRLDHIYYKQMNLINIIETTAWESISSQYTSKYIPYEGKVNDQYITNLFSTLTEVIRKQPNELYNERAILYHIYFQAVNVDFHKAKDMLVSSKVQKHINKAEPSLQILYNRVVVQLGLAAFKLCLIKDCHKILNELLATPHLREILGQQNIHRVVSTNSNSTNAEQREKLCLPFHQHINLDLIDAVFMTCSLLIEVPQMTAFYSGIKIKKMPYFPRSIRRNIEVHDKASFQGPPETLRDYILHAAKAMQKGDWKGCIDNIKSVQAWKLLQNGDEVLATLEEKIQIESLKTYFFSYKRFYNNFSIAKLVELFNLPEEVVIETMKNTIEEFGIQATFEDDKFINIEGGEEFTKLEEVVLKLNKEVRISKERYSPNNRR